MKTFSHFPLANSQYVCHYIPHVKPHPAPLQSFPAASAMLPQVVWRKLTMSAWTRRAQGVDLCVPVGLLHVAAFSLGYFLSKGLGFNEKTARTVSIETGWPLSHPSHVQPLAHIRPMQACGIHPVQGRGIHFKTGGFQVILVPALGFTMIVHVCGGGRDTCTAWKNYHAKNN